MWAPRILAWLLALAASVALAQTRAATLIEGTIIVTVNSTRLKHWGLPGATAAFLPDTDHSADAARIRDASTAPQLCAALAAADGKDSLIVIAPIDGDGNAEHHSGEAELMSFAVTVPDAASGLHGSLYICSQPAFAMMSRGAYPREHFYRASDDHVVDWKSRPLALRPGGSIRLRLTWNIDANTW